LSARQREILLQQSAVAESGPRKDPTTSHPQIQRPSPPLPSDEPPAKGSAVTADQVLLQSVESFLRRSQVTPKFYTYTVPKADLPEFSTDMPILRVVFDERVFFDFDKSDIRSEAEPALDAIATSLRQQSSAAALFVAGHTDSRGSEEYNIALSIRRANSVAQALLKRGIGSASIWQVGFGKSVPLRPNDSDANMAINRRVEFLLATQPKVVATWIYKWSRTLCEGPTQACEEGSGLIRKFIAHEVTLDSMTQKKLSPNPEPRDLQVEVPPLIEIELKPRIFELGPPER
jgi:outer membrane protein OmpA-like peptidoglycan-associated protein